MWEPSSWRRLCRLAFYLGIAGLVAVSLIPGKTLPALHGLDLLYHSLAYAGLSALAAVGYPERRTAGLAMAGLVCLGVILEFTQAMVPGRAGSPADALANAIGAGGVALVWWIWLRRRTAARQASVTSSI